MRGFDDSVREYEWGEIPVSEFDIGDDGTNAGRQTAARLIFEFKDSFHTDGHRMGLECGAL